MTTHVFIVDAITFKIHLEYLFAGTGAGDDNVDFNNCPSTKMKHGKENKLVAMFADASRIRKGDKIIFYLQQKHEFKIYEGKFFGIFEAVENWSFLDENDPQQYLISKLEKSLTFRTLIKPYKIYPKGVTEWEALDEIKDIKSPNQMLWSLIYRKLKGNRGNTMITIYESKNLCHLIKRKNNDAELNLNGKKLSYNNDEQQIVLVDEEINKYKGRKESMNILPRLIEKYNQNKAFEVHLQAYIVANIGTAKNNSLDSSLVNNKADIEWIGNEVSCGVGMQRIDIMISEKNSDDDIVIMPIELKGIPVHFNIVRQIQRYTDWVQQYYLPNRIGYIQPVIICKKTDDKNQNDYQASIEEFKKFNLKNNNNCKPLKFVEYELVDGELNFEIVNYLQ